jgi:arylsulfatase A-like enzyme
LLDDTEVEWPYPAFSQMQIGAITGTSVPGIDGNFMGRSVRTEHWRYMQWGNDGEHGEQLYDMARDPGETRNLANDPAWSNEKAQLRAMVKANVNNGDGRQERVQAQGARR